MKARAARTLILPIALAAMPAGVTATAQPLGSFTWQLQPFCNRVTVNVRQDGAVYTLDGTDDQCGAAQTAPLVGLAAPNPDGSIGFGLNIISPTGQAIPVQARISVATLSGTWSDAAGNGGTFAFGANTGGSPRPNTPATGGDITGVAAGAGLTGGGTTGDVALAVDTTVIQSRVTTACPAGQALRSIAENGTAVCEPITGSAGGDITAVNAGLGLTGGAEAGDVSLAVVFGGDGVLPAAARADHEHVGAGAGSVGVGPGALANSSAGDTTAVGFNALGGAFSGARNTALGTRALELFGSGTENTALGRFGLRQLTDGSGNTVAGNAALAGLTTGDFNTAMGGGALVLLTSGNDNTAVGFRAGLTTSNGNKLTLIGHQTEAALGLNNATAIGANARVDASNALVLGSIAGINGAAADVNVGIGTTTPGARLSIADQSGATQLQLIGAGVVPEIVGRRSQGTLAVPTAPTAGAALLELSGQGFDSVGFIQGARIRLAASENWSAGNHGAQIQFNTTANAGGGSGTRLVIDHDGEVGIGTTTPLAPLHVAGAIRVDALGTAGATALCRNASNQIATCSSSLRYKREVADFTHGLDVVRRLRPIGFRWVGDGSPDVGFGAEDVAAIDSRLAVSTGAGEVEGVKYDRLTTVLVNAVKELEAMVDELRRDRDALRERVAELESRVRK